MDSIRKLLQLGRTILKHGLFIALVCVPCLAVFVDVSRGASSAAVVVPQQKKVDGFLPRGSQPDSVSLLPAPPAEGSAAFAADEDAYEVTRELEGTPRWAQAVEDANLSFPAAAEHFSCELGVQISEQETPHLYNLLLRSKSDAYRATGSAKNHYQRLRPFVVNEESTCTPADEPYLRNSGSYPSAHAATGWVWALILTEIAPDRTDAILARGLAFGQSRVICGVHWQSDVDAGRTIGAAVVARLHADPVFRAEVAAAAAELAAARAAKPKPAHTRPAAPATPVQGP